MLPLLLIAFFSHFSFSFCSAQSWHRSCSTYYLPFDLNFSSVREGISDATQALRQFANINSLQVKEHLEQQFNFMSQSSWSDCFQPQSYEPRPTPTTYPTGNFWVYTSCVMLLMSFYRVFLKLSGLTWSCWTRLTRKTIIPKPRHQLQNLSDHKPIMTRGENAHPPVLSQLSFLN